MISDCYILGVFQKCNAKEIRSGVSESVTVMNIFIGRRTIYLMSTPIDYFRCFMLLYVINCNSHPLPATRMH